LSIKQPYGFIWQITDLMEIHKQVCIYREELYQMFLAELFDMIGNLAVTQYDTDCLEGRSIKSEQEYLRDAHEMVSKLPDNIMNQHHILNPETIVYIIPRNNKLLGVINFLHPEAYRIWFKKPFVKRWWCVTSGDQPNDIPDAEWQERIDDWDFHGYYKELGFALTCHGEQINMVEVMQAIYTDQFDLFRKHYMSYEQRVERMREELMNAYFDGKPGYLKVQYDRAKDELGLFKDISKLTPALFGEK
jgi:hypothetical protein